MKKVLTLLLSLVLVFTLSACRDKKSSDDSVNVIFYTYHGGTDVSNLYHVSPYTLVERPEDPTRVGYTFTGWYTDLNQQLPWFFETDLVGTKSMVLYAGWTPAIYQIIYHTAEGTLPEGARTTFKTGDNVALPRASKEGYTFKGWYTYDQAITPTKPGDNGYQSLPPGLTKDFEIYAHYTGIEIAVIFRIVFPGDAKDKPESPGTIQYEYGSVIDFIDYGEVGGYRFVGWNTAREPSEESTYYYNGDILKRKNNLILYSIWEKI